MDASRYDPIADWYVEWVDSSPSVHRIVMDHGAELVATIPAAGRVLDLGCGEGVFARVLDAAGFRVVGIDRSERLIHQARQRSPSSITFVADDAQTLGSQPSDSFDGAICILAMMDIPDLDAVFRAVYRTVRSRGAFACVVMHSAFHAPGACWLEDAIPASRVVNRYLGEGEWWSSHAAGVRGQVGAWHRTLATYLMTAIGAGWCVQSVAEWPGLPGETPNDDIPQLLLMRFQRGREAGDIR